MNFQYYIKTFAAVAQLVERRTENPYVVGSIPTCGMKEDFQRKLGVFFYVYVR